MIDSYLRAPGQRLFVDPVLARLQKTHMNPQWLTLAALLLGMAIIPALYLGWPVLAVLLLAASGYCDVLDGSLARMQGVESDLGAVFDIVSDRAVEFSVILGLCLVDPEGRALSCIFMLGSVLLCITSFLVVGVFTQNQSEKSFHYSPGIMERCEAFSFFALMMLWPSAFWWLSGAFSLLVALTAAIRVRQFSASAAKA